MKLRRLVEEYAFQDARNFPDHKYAPRYFLLLAKQYVQNPCAVGGASEPSNKYISFLYNFSFVCPEIRAAVDAVKDPFAGIEAMRISDSGAGLLVIVTRCLVILPPHQNQSRCLP